MGPEALSIEGTEGAEGKNKRSIDEGTKLPENGGGLKRVHKRTGGGRGVLQAPPAKTASREISKMQRTI